MPPSEYSVFGEQGLLFEIAQRLSAIEVKLETVTDSIKKLEPIVNDYRDNRNKATGIVLVLCSVAGAIGFFANEIKSLFMGAHG